MRLLVTGRDGQVARCLAERLKGRPDVELTATGRAELDLTRPESVHATISRARPDVVVSAAAYTAVDRAEDEPDLAMQVNAAGAGAVAAAAAAAGAAVIHLSTDYVFAGGKAGAHDEDDEPAPLGVYGRSKLAGEGAVRAANPRHVILRTAWVYSPFGRNFVSVMLDLARRQDSVRVVADQWGNPTSADDVAEGVLRIAGLLCDGQDAHGILHLAGAGSTSRSGFARHVFAESRRLGGPFAEVEEVSTREFAARAARPANSRLCCARLEQVAGWRPPAWQDACTRVVARLLGETAAGGGG